MAAFRILPYTFTFQVEWHLDSLNEMRSFAYRRQQLAVQQKYPLTNQVPHPNPDASNDAWKVVHKKNNTASMLLTQINHILCRTVIA